MHIANTFDCHVITHLYIYCSVYVFTKEGKSLPGTKWGIQGNPVHHCSYDGLSRPHEYCYFPLGNLCLWVITTVQGVSDDVDIAMIALIYPGQRVTPVS